VIEITAKLIIINTIDKFLINYTAECLLDLFEFGKNYD
jgi:hypothetical protein